MRLHAKVVVATQLQPATTQASTSAVGARPGALLLKFTTNKDRQAALRGRKGLTGTKQGLDKDFTPAQQARKSELWSLFKAASKCTFWRAAKLFINNTRICPPSSIQGCGDQRDLCMVLWNMHEGGVNKLKTRVQILKMFQDVNLVLLTETQHFPSQHLQHVEGFDCRNPTLR